MEARNEKKKEAPLLIEIGMRLEAIRHNDQVMFMGRVKDMKERTLKLVSDDGSPVPHIIYGSEIKLRGVWPRVGLVTYHGTVYGSNADGWMIGDLQEWFGWERREFYRQNVSIEAQVLCTYRAVIKTIEVERRVPCRVLDISANGVMFSCSKEVYSVGDLLSISDVEIQPGEKPISFSCEVKRIERSNGYQLYGCEIQNISIAEQDRIARAVFRLQQEERKRTVAGMESQQRSLL